MKTDQKPRKQFELIRADLESARKKTLYLPCHISTSISEFVGLNTGSRQALA